MSDWGVAALGLESRFGQGIAGEMMPEESRIVRAAVLLLRGEVAVLRTGSRAVLAAADGVEAVDSARRLSDPLEAMVLGYRSQLSVPLWRDGRRVGALAVLGRDERRFGDADIALLQALASRMDRAHRSIH
ncbi:GAF domain-containing protein [Sphingomonas sp. ABOLD]|uniref:GAF domain-containing protein n=1 Tax=Sphingomonas trueperi TaxID=53317 RepID=A0A7X6BCU6_9SPHN|nr:MULTISPECIES: GAF domain-containing protein [Sphingomonas]NJB97022.1 GAF domain-containing protein [Sphingomonas trueperi]RSV42816.1 GAF domain-containing protein [Sphingomonas sp. ABOLE]RSV50802.1 GAF domain-containing protein [Sphingomonas sp. ABOLD]